MPARVLFIQLGCPKNIVDGEIMQGLLAEAGCELCVDPDHAEVCVINTCGFIRAAQEESIDEILAAGRWKAAARGRRILVAGCLAQRHGAELLRRLPEVDGLIGPGRLSEVALAVDDIRSGRACLRLGGFGEREPWEKRLRGGAPHTAYLKIAEGCDHRCAFCMIPRLRGRQRSRPLAQIVAEAGELAGEGVHEVVLVAQDTTAYGRDLAGCPTLAELLRALLAADGPEWIRVLYTHPAHWSEELIDLFAGGGRLLRGAAGASVSSSPVCASACRGSCFVRR
jgi:ribosomal protein S12 methylthiotransferase